MSVDEEDIRRVKEDISYLKDRMKRVDCMSMEERQELYRYVHPLIGTGICDDYDEEKFSVPAWQVRNILRVELGIDEEAAKKMIERHYEALLLWAKEAA
jgi:hypothetical protein